MIDVVKKSLCVLLVLWFGLVASLAQAHAFVEVLHQLEHTGQSVSFGDASQTDHEEHCGLSHSAQALCFAATLEEPTPSPVRIVLADSFLHLVTSLVSNDIERPKWASATTAVARL
jgi:hypothetical protein